MPRNAAIDPKRLRLRMVREQIEMRGITDQRILSAMSIVQRHLFVPESLRAHAYNDTPLPIGYGQTISQPYIVALMIKHLAVEPGMRVLEIGAGSGYQTAILATMGCTVFAIERLRELYQTALIRLRELGLNSIILYKGDGTLGMPVAAPFDRIIVAAGGPEIPKPLINQLAEGGIMVIPVGEKQRTQRLLRIQKSRGEILTRDLGAAEFVNLIGDHGWKN